METLVNESGLYRSPAASGRTPVRLYVEPDVARALFEAAEARVPKPEPFRRLSARELADRERRWLSGTPEGRSAAASALRSTLSGASPMEVRRALRDAFKAAFPRDFRPPGTTGRRPGYAGRETLLRIAAGDILAELLVSASAGPAKAKGRGRK